MRSMTAGHRVKSPSELLTQNLQLGCSIGGVSGQERVRFGALPGSDDSVQEAI